MHHARLGLRLTLLLAGAAVLAAAARADNWPRFRGPQGAGVSDDRNIPVRWDDHTGVLWKVALPGIGHSSPVVWGDRLFLESATTDGKERMLLCLDAPTGKVRWTRTVPGSRARMNRLNSLASPTPATDGQRVYALFWDGQDIALHAYDLDGKLAWKTPLGDFKSQHGVGQSPIVYDGKVYLANDQDGSAAVVALDAATGEVTWRTPREAFRSCYSTPFVLDNPADGPELIVASTAGISAYDPKTGTANWSWHWAFDGMALRTVGSPVVAGGLIVANSGDGSGLRSTVAVRVGRKGADSRNSLVWEDRKKRETPYVPCYLARGDYLYYVTDLGVAGCREARSGRVVWTERLSRGFTASPLLIDGKVYACDNEGDVYVFAAEPAFRKLATNALGEPVSATPAVADGRLFVRGSEHLFCIGRPAR
jgi:outer membrane protein assembly factor BamB